MKTRQKFWMLGTAILVLVGMLLAACGGEDQAGPVAPASTDEPTSTVEEVETLAEDDREVVHEPLGTPVVPEDESEAEPVVLESSPFTECLGIGDKTSLHEIAETPWIVYYVHRVVTETLKADDGAFHDHYQFIYYVEAQSSGLVEDGETGEWVLQAQFAKDLAHQNRTVEDAVATWICPNQQTAIEYAEEWAERACDDIIWDPGSLYTVQSELRYYIGAERQDTSWCQPPTE